VLTDQILFQRFFMLRADWCYNTHLECIVDASLGSLLSHLEGIRVLVEPDTNNTATRHRRRHCECIKQLVASDQAGVLTQGLDRGFVQCLVVFAALL